MAEEQKQDEEKVSLVRLLFDAAFAQTRVWRTSNGDLYVDVRQDGSWRTMPLHPGPRSLFGAWLRGVYVSITNGSVAHSRTIDEVVAEFTGRALMTQHPIQDALRVGWGPGGSIWLDLCDGEGTGVEITKEGWRLVKDSPVRFVRGQGMLPLPRPVKGRSLPEELRPLLQTRTEDDLYLLTGWLLGTLRPSGPYPVLIVTGQAGAAKSSTIRFLRKMVDPHALDMIEPPRSSRDFVASVRHNYVTAVDNISFMPDWLSDNLCRLATGTGAIGGRALYTDFDLSSFVACRPIMLNGIPDFVQRGDLMDRSIHVDLPRLEPEAVKAEKIYWKEVEDAWPRILGSLLDAAVVALRDWDSTVLKESPRMADFARWAVASEKAWTEEGRFMQAYKANRDKATIALVEFSVIGQGIVKIIEDKNNFYGSYADLQALLPLYVPAGQKMPQSPQGLAAELRRIAPSLKVYGINFACNGAQKDRKTQIELTKNLPPL